MSMRRTISGGFSRVTTADVARSMTPAGTQAATGDNITSPGTLWKGHLEIQLPGANVVRRALTESHIVMGRVAGVQVFLDHHTVSRRHAEMFCDPFGRWWIRDLGSTNGTLVNDEPVLERVLSPGDRIAVGDYTITFHLESPDASRVTGRSHQAVAHEKPTEIRTLLDFEPPRISAEHLRTLLELSRRLISVESQDDRLAELCALAVRDDFHGLMAVVLRFQDGVATQISSTFQHGGVVGDEAPYVSRRVLLAVRETREPVLAGNLELPGEARSLELTMSREVMELWVIACPLRITDDAIDLLYVTLPPSHGGAEWLSLFALAAEVFQKSDASWAARHHEQAHLAIESELQTARQIQKALLPRRLDFPGLDVAVGFDPCKWVGGDYVDAVQLPDGRVLLAVADVCGKGLQAALVTSSLQTMVRAAVDSNPTLSELMERINRHLCEWLPAHSFVTMVAAAIDPATGEIECVNAGHPPILIADRDGDIRFLQAAENPPLGVDLCTMEVQRALLEFGDVLVIYTDGLTELKNGSKEMLGQDRLGQGFARICAANPDERSSDMAGALDRMLDDFRGDHSPEDDRAFVIAQRSA